MPKYSYKCTQCNTIITIYHSINDKKTDCGACALSGSLQRLPSKFNLYRQEKNNNIGDLVKQSIREFEEDLKYEKEKLRNEFFNPDE
jgi:putative FmdB family regulatory protein